VKSEKPLTPVIRDKAVFLPSAFSLPSPIFPYISCINSLTNSHPYSILLIMILSPLLPLLKNLNKYQHIGAAISSGAEIAINGLVGSSKAYLLSGLLEKLNKSVLIISPRIYEAEQLHEELKTFCPNKETVDYFPSLEVLAYEENPPADELIGQRFAIVDRLARGEVLVLVTSLPAIL